MCGCVRKPRTLVEVSLIRDNKLSLLIALGLGYKLMLDVHNMLSLLIILKVVY
jgi:hypothetical protein